MDEREVADEDPVRLFGDPRSALLERGPDRRAPQRPESTPAAPSLPPGSTRHIKQLEASTAVRLGRGDVIAAVLNGLGLVTFTATLVAGILILYNAKRVGAFSNPWDSTRVAIGLAVLAVGIVLSALLVGVARAISYLLADLRLRAHDMDLRLGERSAAPALNPVVPD